MSNIETINAEVLQAHEDALCAVTEAAIAPDALKALKLFHRCIETWELEILVSQVGQGVGPETLSKIQGALTAFEAVKTFIWSLSQGNAVEEKVREDRAKRFTESLLGQKSRPV